MHGLTSIRWPRIRRREGSLAPWDDHLREGGRGLADARYGAGSLGNMRVTCASSHEPGSGSGVAWMEDGMAQIFSLPVIDKSSARAVEAVASNVIGVAEFLEAHGRCSLCGAPLTSPAERFTMVSPFGNGGRVTVCRACHRAALGEGYRPAV